MTEKRDLPEISMRDLKKASTACFIGNFVEWFDYGVYGYFAVIIGAAFFPDANATVQLLSTYAIFALSYIIRPIGGIFWGAVGDRYGRRAALSWSILTMSAATFCIALIPSYATIGVLAPLLLLVLHVIQGFSASGEYAGASAFLAEYAPTGKRGFYTAIVPASTAAGLLFGALVAAFMQWALSSEFMQAWGWRLPFLLAAPLGLIGRYIRLNLQGSPHFQALAASSEKHQVPIKALFRNHRRQIGISLCVASLNAVAFYILLVYMPVYLSNFVQMNESAALLSTCISLGTYIGLIFMMGVLSDKFGRKKLLMGACFCFIVLTLPLFMLLNTHSIAVVLLVQVLFGAVLAMNDGTLPAFLSEIFPTNVRYTGFAFSFNIANGFLGGSAAFVSTSLIDATGNNLAPGYYLMAVAFVALYAIWIATERSQEALRQSV